MTDERFGDTPRKITLKRPAADETKRAGVRDRHQARKPKPTLSEAKAERDSNRAKAERTADMAKKPRPAPDKAHARKEAQTPRRSPRPPAEPERPPLRAARPGPTTHTARDADAPALLAFFAPCPRGLEEELGKELAELEAGDVEVGHGGCSFSARMPQAWKICLWSRLAIRVLWRVGEGRYRSEDDLYAAALGLPWPLWFTHGKSIAVTTVARQCPLKSLNFITLRIKDAVCDRFRQDTGERPGVQTRDPDIPLLVYLDHDRYSLYIDLVGTPLNRRGYRVQPASAPINENLAAGMLRLSGWRPGTPLFDPMMGGGTILLEAAMMALNQAPGLKRHFSFENLNGFRSDLWARIVGQAQNMRKTPGPQQIFGCDIDPRMVRAAQANFRAAGVGWCIEVREGDARDIDAPTDSGVIVTNPPYGVRLGAEDMTALYGALGDRLKREFSGWMAWVISADPAFPKGIGLKAARRIPLYNGALECRFYRYDLVAGSHRREVR